MNINAKATVANGLDTDFIPILRDGLFVRLPGSGVLHKDSAGNVALGGSYAGDRLDIRTPYGPSGVTTYAVRLTSLGSEYGARFVGYVNAGVGSGAAMEVIAGGAFACSVVLSEQRIFSGSSDNNIALGAASLRFSIIHLGSSPIVTSDERAKREIGGIPDAWLDAWGAVGWARFKMLDGTRWHVGLIAQRVHAAFAAAGLDAFEIGLCCFDAWEATPAQDAVDAMLDEEGNCIRGAQPALAAVPAGDRWGLRYEECFAIEAAWQRRELARQAARIEAIEAALAD